MPSKTYSVIYADPNWSYRDKGMNRGGAERHYRTSPLEQICSLPVSQIAADDSVLFLWATWPTLPDALAVIAAWGFEYKTLGFIWVKTTNDGAKFVMGIGGYTRANSEPCLICTRGKSLRRQDCGVQQVIATPAALATCSTALARLSQSVDSSKFLTCSKAWETLASWARTAGGGLVVLRLDMEKN